MPLTIADTTRNPMVDAATARLNIGTTDPEGKLRLLDGAVLVAEIPFNNPAFGASAAGVASMGVSPAPTIAAVAAGDVDNCEFTNRDDVVEWSGDVGLTASGAVVEMNNTNVAISQTVTLNSGTFTQPASP